MTVKRSPIIDSLKKFAVYPINSEYFKIPRILISSFLAITLTLIYEARPDWATALTIFPAWSWLPMFIPTIPFLKEKICIIPCLLWLCFAILHIEEPRSLLRSLTTFNKERTIRVITINCSGSIESLNDARTLDPDIILVQETPNKSSLEAFIQENKEYRFSHEIDTSIVAKAEIKQIAENLFYNITTINGLSPSPLQVVSLRLATSDPRIDLWNPRCWIDQQRMRIRQKEQIQEITAHISNPNSTTTILGGDFNVPQGDKVFSFINNSLHDSFNEGGRGWCNTILTDLPLLRIDQIWLSHNIEAVNAFSKECMGTDHKMYVTDIRFK